MDLRQAWRVGHEPVVAAGWQGATVLAITAAAFGHNEVARLPEDVRKFFLAGIPSVRTILLGGPGLLAWSVACLWLAAWSKRDRQVATGYSRKLFHLLIFMTAGVLQMAGNLQLVCLFGGLTTLTIAYAIWCGAGHAGYEALARESDAPHRTYYIVTAYLATLAGGVLSNLVAGRWALLGYLVCGLGDAAGEPAGTRWGRHTYVVPGWLGGHSTRRSLEGSAAVFLVSLVALTVGMALLEGRLWAAHNTGGLFATAALCTLVEALSPHGWDNATMQLAPPLLAGLLLVP